MNFKYKRFFVVLVMFFLLGSMVFAVYAEADGDSAQESGVKTIKIGLDAAPLTLDPVDYTHRQTQTLHRMFSDGLKWTTPEGKLVLDLAESITQLDEVTYEIKIREDVYFHNGDHMTADDLVFSLKRIGTEGGMEGSTSPRRKMVGPYKSVEKTDDYTVIVKLETTQPIIQTRSWYHVDIWPKKYFEEVGGIDGFIKHPIGTGPFKWVEGDLASSVLLERNETYYGGCTAIQGAVDRIPALDRVIVNFIPEPTTRVAALLAGDVDIIKNVPIDSVKLLEDNPNTKVETTEGTNIVYMAFNTTKAPFDDKRVRQAIAYAIDYDLLTEKIYLGYSEPLYGCPFIEPYPDEPGSGSFDNVQSPYRERDLEKAKALLEEAGVSGFSTIIDTDPRFSEQAQAVAQMLGDIGIDASVRVWEWSVISVLSRGTERDIFFASSGNDGREPQMIQNVTKTGRVNNRAHYNNPYYDSLIDKVLEMSEDSPERNALFIEAFEIIIEDVPVIFIHVPRDIDAIRNNIKNYYACPSGRINLHRVDLE